MKKLQAPYFPIEYRPAVLTKISKHLDLLKKEVIGLNPWVQYDYLPAVKFAVAQAGDAIFIKYYVSEKDVKATCTKTNEPVYQDSCVEFFIGVQDDESYYNFEFNSRGVCLAGYGNGRKNRQILPAGVISEIQTLSLEPHQDAEQNYRWELCLAFPLTVFYYHQLEDICGKSFIANFYKCGDHAAKPHFLVWNNILSKEPDFHLPEFFGILTFDPSPLKLN